MHQANELKQLALKRREVKTYSDSDIGERLELAIASLTHEYRNGQVRRAVDGTIILQGDSYFGAMEILEGFLSSITQYPNNINGVTAGMQWYCFFCGHLEPHEVKNDETCSLCGSRLPKRKIEDGSLVEKRWNEYREFQKNKG